jgi:hypothetical protein
LKSKRSFAALGDWCFFKPSPLAFLSWGRRHAPPPLRKLSFLSLPSTRRLRRFGQLVFHTSLLFCVILSKPAAACPCSDDPGGRGFMTTTAETYGAALSVSSRRSLGQFDAHGKLRMLAATELEASEELLLRFALRAPRALEWQAELGAASYRFHTQSFAEQRRGLGDAALWGRYLLVEESMPHEPPWPALSVAGLLRAPLGAVASRQSSFGSGGVQLGLGTWELGGGVELQRSLGQVGVWWSVEFAYRLADQALGRPRKLGPRADVLFGANLELADWLSASASLAARFVGDVRLSGRTLEGTGERLVSTAGALSVKASDRGFRSSIGLSLDPPFEGLSKNTTAAWALTATLGLSR